MQIFSKPFCDLLNISTKVYRRLLHLFFFHPLFPRSIRRTTRNSKLAYFRHIYCRYSSSMSNLDLTIIYLACGSPFGAYYFLRTKEKNLFSLICSIGVTLLWMPYAVSLFHTNVASRFRKRVFDEKAISVLNESSKLDRLKKEFEEFLPKSRSSLSLFEFRELIERYSGLSIASKSDEDKLTCPNAELFGLAGHSNPGLASIILNRRNRLKLDAHLTDARLDFLKCLSQMFESADNTEKLRGHSHEFVTLLNDAEAASEIETIFRSISLVQTQPLVKVPEYDLWSLEKQPPLINNPNSKKLKVLAATKTSPSDA